MPNKLRIAKNCWGDYALYRDLWMVKGKDHLSYEKALSYSRKYRIPMP